MSKEKTLGGYDIKNMSDPSVIFVSKDKIAKMSYRLHDIEIINGSEILKLKLRTGLICRIMKFVDEASNQPSLMIDIVNEENKTIVYKTDEIYYNGMGVGGSLVINELIGQWEIVPTDNLCRSFLFGDKLFLLKTLDEYNIKISRSADWYIRNEME